MQHRTVFQDPRDESCICCSFCEKFPTSIHPLDTALDVQQNCHDVEIVWKIRGYNIADNSTTIGNHNL
jgi:hypothetical protein